WRTQGNGGEYPGISHHDKRYRHQGWPPDAVRNLLRSARRRFRHRPFSERGAKVALSRKRILSSSRKGNGRLWCLRNRSPDDGENTVCRQKDGEVGGQEPQPSSRTILPSFMSAPSISSLQGSPQPIRMQFLKAIREEKRCPGAMPILWRSARRCSLKASILRFSSSHNTNPPCGRVIRVSSGKYSEIACE